MNNNDKIKHIFNSQIHAKKYEEKAKTANWAGPDIVFGLSFPYTKPGELLLDIGTGTGLSSELYHKAGLLVYGMDNSSSMLTICAEKGIAKELKQHDMLVTPYPYADNSMDHIVCVGVFHLFNDLSPVFAEVGRILKNNGYFSFSLLDCVDNQQSHTIYNQKTPNKSVAIFHYNQTTVQTLLKTHKFNFVKSIDFLGLHGNQETRFKAYLAQNCKI